METPQQAIRDFLKAVDKGFFGEMPSGFNDSAFVIALRAHVYEEFECPSCRGAGDVGDLPNGIANECKPCGGTGTIGEPVSVEDQRKYGVIR